MITCLLKAKLEHNQDGRGTETKKSPEQHSIVIHTEFRMLGYSINTWHKLKTESGYKWNIFEVFMLKSTPGCNPFAGIQAEHFLKPKRRDALKVNILYMKNQTKTTSY